MRVDLLFPCATRGTQLAVSLSRPGVDLRFSCATRDASGRRKGKERHVRSYLTGAPGRSEKSYPGTYNRAAHRLVLLFFVVVFGIGPLFGDKAVRKNDARKKGAAGDMLSLSADPAPKSPEQMTQEILFFMNRYHSFAGTPAVLDNIKDLDRLGKFLREYKVLNAQTQADARFLQ